MSAPTRPSAVAAESLAACGRNRRAALRWRIAAAQRSDKMPGSLSRPGPPVYQQSVETTALAHAPSRAAAVAVIYLVAFVTGAIVMSFEMLGSRYLNPYFGSGIYTWAALISTVLAALTAGYFLGGWLADRTASATVLGSTVLIASLYLLALPGFAEAVLEYVLAD